MGCLFVFVCDKVVVEAWNKAVENYVDCCGRWAKDQARALHEKVG